MVHRAHRGGTLGSCWGGLFHPSCCAHSEQVSAWPRASVSLGSAARAVAGHPGVHTASCHLPHPCQHRVSSAPHWRVVAPHCDTDLHFPEDLGCGASSHGLICHPRIFFGKGKKNVHSVLLPVFNGVVFLVLSCERSFLPFLKIEV